MVLSTNLHDVFTYGRQHPSNAERIISVGGDPKVFVAVTRSGSQIKIDAVVGDGSTNAGKTPPLRFSNLATH